MPKTPHQVFSVFNLAHLQYMAESRNIDTTDKSKKQLVQDLTNHVNSLGLSVVLRILKVKDLKILSNVCKIEDDKLGKATLAKKIQEVMEEEGPDNLLLSASYGKGEELLGNILKAMEIPFVSDTKEEQIEIILRVADEMGLENFLSSFPTTKIKEFVKHCGLKVDSDSLDNLLRALIEQESVKQYFAGTTEESLSKIQPQIDENITVAELFNYYFREDLVKWCDANTLTSHGSKKELVERIRRKFDDKLDQSKDIKRERKNSKKNSIGSKDSVQENPKKNRKGDRGTDDSSRISKKHKDAQDPEDTTT
jgi:hypothetical protein